MVPVLCNSTSSVSSAQSSKIASGDFCVQVWDSCKDVPIRNSPFAASLQGAAGQSVSSSRLSDLWQSETDFCKAFGGSANSESVCFNGQSASFNSSVDSAPKGICLEKLGNGSYLSMVPHPDGSNRVFLSDQAGKIWLATVPAQGSGGTLDFNESSTFLDITDMVHYDTAFGVMGLAFHPNFTSNGRFFVSYNCDKTQTASCSGRCSCNSDVDCDPAKLGLNNGIQPCRYQSVISEFTVNGSSSTTPSEATFASPSEVRRIFTMGLPYTEHHGGQILFGPEDGYLYFMMGDGGNDGDPFNFAQNKKSLLGKIMRLDVNNIPSSSEINDLGLWGNYSIPKDNPSADDSQLQDEIWALGLRNPWRCSFDSKRPSYFFCADVGQEAYEEVDLISKGGNYGWRLYEGSYPYHPKWTPGGNTSLNSINPIFPVMGYNHSSVNTNVGSASISGGYVYRAQADPCLYGRYLYADLYGLGMWAGIENPENSGNYSSTELPFNCAKETPIACDPVEGSHLPSLGIVYSFAEDNSKDVYLLASKGVYRIVRPSLCNYTCPQESHIDNGSPPPGSSSSTGHFENLQLKLILLLISLIILLSSY